MGLTLIASQIGPDGSATTPPFPLLARSNIYRVHAADLSRMRRLAPFRQTAHRRLKPGILAGRTDVL